MRIRFFCALCLCICIHGASGLPLQGEGRLPADDASTPTEAFQLEGITRSAAVAVDPAAVTAVTERINAGDVAGARQALEGLQARHPDNAGLWEIHGLLKLMSREPVVAEESLRRALELAPELPSIQGKLGSALLAQNRIDEAKPVLHEALRLDPDNVLANHLLARLATVEGDAAAAEVHYRAAIGDAIGPSVLHSELAQLLASLGRTLEAGELLQEAGAGPSSMKNALNLARIQLAQGEPALAAKTLAKVTENGPEDLAVWVARIALLAKGGLYREAIAAVKDGQLYHPNHPALRFQLANVHEIAGNDHRRAAIAQYREMMTDATVRAVAMNNLAMLLVDDEYTRSEAIALARQAVEVAPDIGPIRDTLGWVLFRSGEADEALELLRQAFEATPNDPGIICHLAIATAAEAGSDVARSQLERCVSSAAPANLVAIAKANLGD